MVTQSKPASAPRGEPMRADGASVRASSAGTRAGREHKVGRDALLVRFGGPTD